MGPSSELCGTLPVTHHKTRPDVHTYSIVYWHTFISVKTNQKLSRVTEQINKKLTPHSVRSPPRQWDIKTALSVPCSQIMFVCFLSITWSCCVAFISCLMFLFFCRFVCIHWVTRLNYLLSNGQQSFLILKWFLRYNSDHPYFFLSTDWLFIWDLGKRLLKDKSRFLTAECLCYFNLRGLNFSPCWISCFCCTWRHKSLYPYHCHTSHLTGMLPEVVNLLL